MAQRRWVYDHHTMGFRMRKSIRLAPGVRLNVSKRGLGMSAGGWGSAIQRALLWPPHDVGSDGCTRRLLPTERKQRASKTSARSLPQAVSPPALAKPGLFAKKAEKQLWKAINAQDLQEIKRVGEEEPGYRVVAWSIAGLQLAESDPSEAARLLENVFASGHDPATTVFASQYLRTHVSLDIASGVKADLPLNRDAVGLALAELKQEAGDLDGAIETVEQLEPTTYAAVSLRGAVCTGRPLG